jgi:hypothetical protein
VQNRKYLIYFGSQKTRTEFHNSSFGSVSSVPVHGYFGSVPRFRFFLPRPTPEDISPAHGLGNPTPALVPPADDPARFQPPLLHLLGLGSHLLLGRRSFLFKPTPPLSMLTPLPPAPAHRRAAEVFPNLNKRGLGWQGRPSRGTPTPLGYGYLTRHLPHGATRTWLSGPASRQASPAARNEEETRYCAQIP